MCFDCWRKKDEALVNETSPSTLKIRGKRKAASADGKTLRWKWKVTRTDLLVSSCTKDIVKDEWNSSCDRPEPWQARGHAGER